MEVISSCVQKTERKKEVIIQGRGRQREAIVQNRRIMVGSPAEDKVVLQGIKEERGMGADDIIKIIDAIPQYIRYVYPGYLAMFIFCFLRGTTLRETKAVLVKAIAISYIFTVILSLIPLETEIAENAVLIVMSVILPYIAYLFGTFRWVKWVLRHLKVNTTLWSNEMESLIGDDNCGWLVVYLKDDNVVYEGSLGNRELEAGRRQFITLEAFYKYRLDKKGYPKEPYIEDHEGNYEEKVVIFYDSIKRIEKRDTRGSVQTSAEEPAC